MNFNMNIPGLTDVEITKIEELKAGMAISIELPHQAQAINVQRANNRQRKCTITELKKLST